LATGGFLARILVADDETDILELLKLLLQKDGHEILTASNGREAVEIAETQSPDLIILDIMMPQMDGYAVWAKLSENPATRTLPIIILTAKAKMRDLFEVATNIVGYLEKPFDPKLLREKIQEAIAKSNLGTS